MRRICDRCKESYTAEPGSLAALGDDAALVQESLLWRGRGCLACKQTGYYGRIAVFEVLGMTAALRRLVLDGANEDQIKQRAMADGVATLRKSGIRKVLEGQTTVEEVLHATLTDHA